MQHILTKTVFLQKVSHRLLNCAFLLFWSILVEIYRELFFLDIKWLSQKRHRNTQNFFFYHVWKGQILRKICISLNNSFWSNQQNATYINKTVFFHKVSHILLNYAFLLFWSFFGKIHRELFFFDIKMTITVKASKY